jgi:NAD(P)-dependent dehydrogenase (short-subunit alcohol dehydrogenase family)
MRLDGKTAIVTGAGGGIGSAVARRLASEGARVVLASLHTEKHDALTQQLGDAAVSVRCDVTNEAEVAACFQLARRRFGRVDAVINNAGLMTFKPIAELVTDDWLKVLHVDLLGAAHFTKLLFLQEGGSAVVNIASVHAVRTTANVAPYAASKAALVSLTRSAAIEGKSRGIRANAILPGAIDTPMLWTNPNLKSGAEMLDKADVGQPEDIAAAVAFLASDDAAFVTGAALDVDGGRLARL